MRKRRDYPGLGNDTQTPKGRSFHKVLRTSFFPWASGGADLFLMQREPALTAFGRALGGICLVGVESFPETAAQFSFASVSQAHTGLHFQCTTWLYAMTPALSVLSPLF